MSRSKFRNINVDQKSLELLSECSEYMKIHADQLMDKFVTCFEHYCQKILHMQQAGKKGAIAFIYFSVLRTNILTRRHVIRLDAYDQYWYQDRVECSDDYEVSEFYQYLDKFVDMLENARRQSVGKITLEDVQRVIFEESNPYLLLVAEFIRSGMKKVIETESYQAMKREDCFMVCLGGYQDRADILYKEDSRMKDAEEMKRYMESGIQVKFTHEICEKLDLSRGCYEGLKFMFSSFAECDFTGSSWDNSMLLFSDFKQTMLRDTSFKGAQILDTDFSGAVLENVDFKGAKLRHLSFKGAKLKHVIFADALMAMELDFTGAELHDTELPEVK